MLADGWSLSLEAGSHPDYFPGTSSEIRLSRTASPRRFKVREEVRAGLAAADALHRLSGVRYPLDSILLFAVVPPGSGKWLQNLQRKTLIWPYGTSRNS